MSAIEQSISSMSVSERSAVRTAIEGGGVFYVESSQRTVDSLESRGLVEYLPGLGAVLTTAGVEMFRHIEMINAHRMALASA